MTESESRMARAIDIDIAELSESEIHEDLYTALLSKEHNCSVIEKLLVSHLGMSKRRWALPRHALRSWLRYLNNRQLAQIRVLLEPIDQQ